MIRGALARLIGVVLILGGLLGLVVSVLGIVLVWSSEGRINRQVASAAVTAREALDGADDMLGVTATAVSKAESQLGAVEETLSGVSRSLEETAITTRAFGELASTDLAGVVTNTLTALQSVALTAGLVDSTLSLLTGLPLIGGGQYEPSVPLAESIGRVERSLRPVPGQLVEIRGQLDQAADSIDTIRGSLERVSGQMGSAESSLQAAETSIADYQETVGAMQEQAGDLEADVARVLRIVSLFVTAGLLWLLVAQIGLLTQGYEWIRREDVP